MEEARRVKLIVSVELDPKPMLKASVPVQREDERKRA